VYFLGWSVWTPGALSFRIADGTQFGETDGGERSREDEVGKRLGRVGGLRHSLSIGARRQWCMAGGRHEWAAHRAHDVPPSIHAASARRPGPNGDVCHYWGAASVLRGADLKLVFVELTSPDEVVERHRQKGSADRPEDAWRYQHHYPARRRGHDSCV
jgi:hypothetical protein